MKVCRKCQVEKSLEEFSNYSASKDGKRPWCRQCMNAQNIVYMKTERGREVHRVTNDRYYSSNKGRDCRKRDHERWKDYRLAKSKTAQGIEYRKQYRKSIDGRKSDNKTQKRLRIKYPEKYAARSMVRQAIVLGILVRPENCNACNQPCKPEGHHDDYFRPLDVKWLCKKCHTIEDRKHE